MKEIREIVSGDRGKLNPPGQQPGELAAAGGDKGGENVNSSVMLWQLFSFQ